MSCKILVRAKDMIALRIPTGVDRSLAPGFLKRILEFLGLVIVRNSAGTERIQLVPPALGQEKLCA